MKIIPVLGVAGLFLFLGFRDSFKQKQKTAILNEIVGFLRFVRSELQYRATDFETLGQRVKNENLKYIGQNDDSFYLTQTQDEKIIVFFESFINHLGTTDKDGQLNLCDEYIEKFSEILTEHKKSEKSKIQINTALSVFGALCIVILFI